MKTTPTFDPAQDYPPAGATATDDRGRPFTFVDADDRVSWPHWQNEQPDRALRLLRPFSRSGMALARSWADDQRSKA